MNYDTNNDGNFSMLEVEAIVRGKRNFFPFPSAIVKDMQTAQKEATNMGRLALAVAIVGLLFSGALLGLMFAANGTTIIYFDILVWLTVFDNTQRLLKRAMWEAAR